jgi:hypothetical protein
MATNQGDEFARRNRITERIRVAIAQIVPDWQVMVEDGQGQEVPRVWFLWGNRNGEFGCEVFGPGVSDVNRQRLIDAIYRAITGE